MPQLDISTTPRSPAGTRRHPLWLSPALLHVCLTLLLLLVVASIGWAFIPLTMEPTFGSAVGLVKKWDLSALPDGRIPYWINLSRPAGAAPVGPNTSPDEIIKHVRNAFQTWENVPTSRIRFQYMGTTTATNGFDGLNVVTFSPREVSFNPRQPVLPVGRYAAAAGPVRTDAGTMLTARFPGQVLECDIVINPQLQGVYTVSDAGNLQPGRDYDLQGYLVHEIGHSLGLDHTNTGLDAAMNISAAPRGGFTFRNLSTDDVIGISVLYPEEEFLESRGSIGGTVRRPDGRPVFGAHIVAMDAQTGVIVTSTSTGLSELYPDGTPMRLSVGRGEYRLVGLPPGTYRLYAEPLDGPGINVLSGVFWSSDFQRQLMETDFTPAFAAGSVTVNAKQLVGNIDITVGARSPSAPNLGISTFISQGAGMPFTELALARPGTEPTFAMPPGLNLQSGNAFVPDTRFAFFGQDVTITQALSRPGVDTLLSLTIAADAAFGPRLLQATTRDGVSFLSGGLILFPPPPVIDNIRVLVALGRQRVFIEGANFTATSLPIVLFNSEMATELIFETPTRLVATTPPGIGFGNPVETRLITLGGIAVARNY